MLLQKTLIFFTALLHKQRKCGYFVGMKLFLMESS